LQKAAIRKTKGEAAKTNKEINEEINKKEFAKRLKKEEQQP
jgi:hypothetical protein